MDVNFELYEEGPVGWTRERVHVTGKSASCLRFRDSIDSQEYCNIADVTPIYSH